MADPTGYARSYSFTNWQVSKPKTPLPAHEVDNELDNIAQAVSETQSALADIRRSDGALQNGVVMFDPNSVDTVGDLIADTFFTYTPMQEGTVAAGDFIRTRVEAFSYSVAAPAASDHHITTAGGMKLYVLPTSGRYNLMAFGADPSGSIDAATIAQKALDVSIAAGVPLYAPTGAYLFGSPLIADLPAETGIFSAGRWALIGDGAGSTVFNYTGPDATWLLTITGPAWGTAGTYAHLAVSGITFNGLNYLRYGVLVDRLIGYRFDDCAFAQFSQAHYIRDVVYATYDHCQWTFNVNGIRAEPSSAAITTGAGSPPNEMTFVSCLIANNRGYGAWFLYSAPVTFLGGSIESNGRPGPWTAIPTISRWDVRISNGGFNGAAALNMFGTHFESSGGTASIWIEHTDYAATYNFMGLDFLRNGVDFGYGADHTINCILLETTGASRCNVNVHGCGFRSVNGYVPSAARKTLAESASGGDSTLHKFSLLGNIYNDAVEAPTVPVADVLGTAVSVNGFPASNEAEHDANGNGSYVKFPDGTMICRHVLPASAVAAATWTFPAAFKTGTTPTLKATPHVGGLPRFATCSATGSASAQFWCWDPSGTQVGPDLHVEATGRWF